MTMNADKKCEVHHYLMADDGRCTCHASVLEAADWFEIPVADVTRQQMHLIHRLRFGGGGACQLHPHIVKRVETMQPDLDTKSFFIAYQDDRQRWSRRRITPVSFWFSERGDVGVYAWCHLRDDFRTFFLARMRNIDPIDRIREITALDVINALVEMPVGLRGRHIQRMVDGGLIAELCVRGYIRDVSPILLKDMAR